MFALTWVHVLAGAALLAGAPPLARLVFRLQIHSQTFLAAIVKLLDSDNLARAIKLCSAVPSVPLARGVRRMLQAHEAGTTDSRALREAFEHEPGGIGHAVLGWTWLSWLALALFAGAAVSAALPGVPPRPEELGLGLAALLVAALGLRKAYRLRAQIAEAREALLTHLQERALRR
ncbi:MAG TPA: hypothetical protein PK668_02590 [Myxococcota bacterium]|nr:hypothetical protein [Myxococcota bacterium]HRY94543.1 hypothetical protein [Myxococcota bacterium]